MDVLSLIGLIMAFVAIIGGNYLEGGHLGALANGPAALIVLGGTVGAALLQSPMSAFKRAMQILAWIFFPPRVDLAGGIDRVVNWSLTARKEGLLGLEGVADAEPDSYSRKGLQLLVDGAEPEAIRSILEVDFYTQESRDIEAAKVFESMGGYAPTIGIIGAVMGLIHVMGNLADPSQLGNGIAVAFVAIIGGNYLEGGHLGALANGPAALIVLGGMVGAALLQSPMSAFKRAMQILGWIFFPPRVDLAGGIDRVVNWSLTARKEGLLGLEGVADAEPDSYSRKGLQLLVDGAEPEAIRSILEVDFYTQESRDIEAAKVFESMGGYAPTIGIIGAVMGLIHVMGNLADPSQLGNGIAVAFVATIYGVASANLILLPVAAKLKSIALRQSRYREMLLEGILSIAEGENPRSIELKLQGFMD